MKAAQHCPRCIDGQRNIAGQDWCDCHARRNRRLTWKERADRLRLRILTGGRA